MRRSGGVSKILLMKKLKSKVYVSFLISLYDRKTNSMHYTWNIPGHLTYDYEY